MRHLKAVIFPSALFNSLKEKHNIKYFSVIQARTASPQALNAIVDFRTPTACWDRQSKGIYLADMNIRANRTTIHSYVCTTMRCILVELALQSERAGAGGSPACAWEASSHLLQQGLVDNVWAQ